MMTKNGENKAGVDKFEPEHGNGSRGDIALVSVAPAYSRFLF